MVSLGTQPANRKSGFGHSSPTGARAQDLSRQPARPDLWGARVSNDPGLPDHTTLRAARCGAFDSVLPAHRDLSGGPGPDAPLGRDPLRASVLRVYPGFPTLKL